MNRQIQTIMLSAFIIIGFGLIWMLSSAMDAQRIAADPNWDDEDLLLSSPQIRSVSGDFRGLVADWYWINSLQYLGKKVVNANGYHELNLNDLSALKLKMLYPMLDRTTTLDPGYRVAYMYGAVILPAVNVDNAIKFIEKGIADNPDDWVLYQHLGYIYWQEKNYDKASEVYAQGAKIPGAAPFLAQMSAKVKLDGGSRETSRQIYQQIYDTAEDTATKDLVGMRLLQIVSLDERDAILKLLLTFQDKNGRCPSSWTEINGALRAIKLPNGKSLRADRSGAPVDPTDLPYLMSFSDGKCNVTLDPNSKIPPS